MRSGIVLLPRGGELRCEIPATRRERRRGLLGRDRLEGGQAMLFEHTRSVHTFGMRFPIMVAFLDRHDLVVRAVRMPPRRITLPRPGVARVLECADGVDLRAGDRLRRRRDPEDACPSHDRLSG